MTISPTPVEKQLINLNLAKGMDERTRGELNDGITLIENLVQDQTGCWVKRDGTTLDAASDASGSSTYPSLPKKILSLLNGWGVIADQGRLLHKQDTQATFRARQYHMDFASTQASFVGSSGPVAQDGVVGASIKTVASCSTHDAYVSSGLPNISGGGVGNDKLTICERSTGVEYVYDTGLIAYPLSAHAGLDARAVFVSDRFLHVFVSSLAPATKLSVIVIDVQSPLPTSSAGVSAFNVVTLGGGAVNLFDAVGGTVSSFVLIGNGGGTSSLYQLNSGGAVQDTITFPAGHSYQSLDVDEATTNLWLIAPGATTRFVAQWCLGVSITNVATFTSANPGTFVSCNTTTHDVRILYAYSATVGGTTVDSIQVLNLASGAVVTTVVGGAYGWTVCSRPWYMSQTNRHYAQLSKYDSINEISSHVIADLSTFTQSQANSAGLATPFGSFRNACNLEPYAGLRRFGNVIAGATGYAAVRYATVTGTEVSVCVPYQVAQRAEGVAFHRLRLTDHTAYGACNFAGSTHVAHGGLNSYDGRNFFDQGFADMPIVNAVVSAVAGNLAGSYRYVAVYRHIDANGVSTYSRTFGPVSTVNLAAGSGKNTITITPWAVTNRDDGIGASVPFVELYRTKSGGTQYYLCASSQSGMSTSKDPLVQAIGANATTALMGFTDNLSDAQLGAQAIMYRQPGTTNAPADRYASPSCKFAVQHKDRIFCADPYGQRVYYSSFFVDGEAPWFNPAFNFFVHNGTGPITGLASMDGRLYVFKRDAIFAVDGDGPGEAGPTGNEFSPPQSLAGRYGCIDHRSIVLTPKGIIYRSTRGIEMLGRDLKIEWIGERVQNTVAAKPITTGACMDKDGRVRMTLAASEASYGGVFNVAGVELIYDTLADAWSVARYTGGISYGKAQQNVGIINVAGTEYTAYADSSSGVYTTKDATGMDFVSYAPFTIESGWIKQGPQARQRVCDVMMLAKKQAASNHALKISFAYDYSDTYTQTNTWEPSDINVLGIEELDLQPATQQVLAIRVKIEDQAPADTVTYPVGEGRGCDILAITAEVAAKTGSPKLAAGQKA